MAEIPAVAQWVLVVTSPAQVPVGNPDLVRLHCCHRQRNCRLHSTPNGSSPLIPPHWPGSDGRVPVLTWRPRTISSLFLSSSVAFSYLLFFVWIFRLEESPPSNRVWLLQSSVKNAGLNTIPSIPNRLVSLSLTDGEDWTVSPACGVSWSHFLSI